MTSIASNTAMKPRMRLLSIAPMACVVAAQVLLPGCASTLDQAGLEQRTAQAIGHSAGQFTITDQQEEIGGRVSYTVSTSEGATYRCYLYGATGFQKAMSFGQTPHSDAICTDMVGSKPSSKHQAPATAPEQPGRNRAKACNALQRTAGRC
ncbi:hypothetical protein [Ottowia sp.]|uniref:hypothetical protein n=1 Tax=Ottowia sp. TaxID=1898956 RepID=UPI002BCEDDC1|nr:hypothetical protein [Ottowia sp.]HMZ86367.1 hypothetical protein [Giesbergeria sp.]HNI76321.1 hypothetical protein [Giesbergeria sp.]HNN17206.1 hypothetical protein [Giesbergeria sp.]